eukprot:6186501-Pleurochrysis_carterae.AAC.1
MHRFRYCFGMHAQRWAAEGRTLLPIAHPHKWLCALMPCVLDENHVLLTSRAGNVKACSARSQLRQLLLVQGRFNSR